MQRVFDGDQTPTYPMLRSANKASIAANILIIPPNLDSSVGAVQFALNEYSAPVAVKHAGAGTGMWTSETLVSWLSNFQLSNTASRPTQERHS